MQGWCPKCQKITQHLVEDTLIIHQVSCLECKTLLNKYWKIPGKEGK